MQKNGFLPTPTLFISSSLNITFLPHTFFSIILNIIYYGNLFSIKKVKYITIALISKKLLLATPLVIVFNFLVSLITSAQLLFYISITIKVKYRYLPFKLRKYRAYSCQQKVVILKIVSKFSDIILY